VGEVGEDWSPDMEGPSAVSPAQADEPTVSEPVAAASPPKGPPKALPAARKLAAELGIALETLTGTGPSGLITPKDVEAAADSGGASSSSLLENRQPMSMLRKSIAANLLKSWQEIPHAAMGWQVDMTRFFEHRKELVEQTGSKIRPEAILMAALVPLLKKYPGLNARVEGTDIIYYEQVNLGFSVGSEEGLMVAVVHNAETLSVEQLSAEVANLTDAAMNKRLPPEALTGLTFTVNNTGPLGNTHGGTMILPLGTSAVLGMERTIAVSAPR
jgi:pyruvate/2-oxoglutarate dehydrogenase complex dihydrolipoamide acyltransferase (E2) component